MTTLAERTDRQTLRLFASLTAVLGLLALLLGLAYRHYSNDFIRLEFDSPTYQGVGHCVLVADVYSGVLADSATNRVEIKYTEDCDFCSDAWSMPGSESYRVRVFVRPCLSLRLLRSP